MSTKDHIPRNVSNRQAYRPGLVAALDVGSSKIVCLIAKVERGELRVIGSALRESRGVRRGTIVDLHAAEHCIREVVANAEAIADVNVEDVVISVNCGRPTNLTAQSEMHVDGALISDARLLELRDGALAKLAFYGYFVFQRTIASYSVDNVSHVTFPVGMYCENLGLSVSGLGVKRSPLLNLRHAVERADLTVTGALFGAYASALAVLSDEEMQLGTTVIDLGAGVTSIATFLEGRLVYADSVPLGAAMVTSDIARLLATPVSSAERIKILHGDALAEHRFGTDLITVPRIGDDSENTMSVPRFKLAQIIQARLEEIFDEVRRLLHESGFEHFVGRTVVLTGGGCQLPGTQELATRILNKQVRIGHSQNVSGLAAVNQGPQYSAVIGLLIAGATMPRELLDFESQQNLARSPDQNSLETLMAYLFGFFAQN